MTNGAIVYKRQSLLKVIVHVIIIDMCNQMAHLTISRYRLFIAMPLWPLSAVDRGLSVKPVVWHLGH